MSAAPSYHRKGYGFTLNGPGPGNTHTRTQIRGDGHMIVRFWNNVSPPAYVEPALWYELTVAWFVVQRSLYENASPGMRWYDPDVEFVAHCIRAGRVALPDIRLVHAQTGTFIAVGQVPLHTTPLPPTVLPPLGSQGPSEAAMASCPAAAPPEDAQSEPPESETVPDETPNRHSTIGRATKKKRQ